jgi:hypothetical protein
MTAEEQALLMECLVEIGQVDPEGTAVEQAFDFEVWYAQRRGQVNGEIYYAHILAGAKAWRRAQKAGRQLDLI